MLQTLSLRDKMTARHSRGRRPLLPRDRPRAGAVASRTRTSCTPPALLHDIGKFIFPDRILLPTKAHDEDLEIVRRHPAQGARVVARIDGYGPVADIILAHHERIDGKGYPRGLWARDPAARGSSPSPTPTT